MLTRTLSPVQVQDALSAIYASLRRSVKALGSERPLIGRADLSYTRTEHDFWVEGFWSGQLWLAYSATKNEVFLRAAREQRPYFEARLGRPDTHDHDMGFLYSLSAVADYLLTGDPAARDMGLRAAESLRSRFNAKGNFIRAWNAWGGVSNEGRIIIDCTENLALLFWAHRETGDDRFYQVAVRHAETAARYLIRNDGSSFHVYDFDPASGEPLRGGTFQGFSDNSCWSRGQAWAVHGFAQVYAYTKEPLFLETAVKTADYALKHAPPGVVPFWDYHLPETAPPYRDSSAGAISAAGLLLLADQLSDAARARRYRDGAQNLVRQLLDDYTTFAHPEAEGLLKHGAGFVAEGNCDTMLPYGDYFFLEALLRLDGHEQFFW